MAACGYQNLYEAECVRPFSRAFPRLYFPQGRGVLRGFRRILNDYACLLWIS